MICKYTSGYIYQVVSGEFPWAVTCSEKEYITEKSWMSRRWRKSANTKRFAFRIRDIKAVHSKDIVLVKHVAAKRYCLANIPLQIYCTIIITGVVGYYVCLKSIMLYECLFLLFLFLFLCGNFSGIFENSEHKIFYRPSFIWFIFFWASCSY